MAPVTQAMVSIVTAASPDLNRRTLSSFVAKRTNGRVIWQALRPLKRLIFGSFAFYRSCFFGIVLTMSAILLPFPNCVFGSTTSLRTGSRR